MLAVAAWGFQVENVVFSYSFGWCLVVAAFVNVGTGFCIPSLLYGLLFGKSSAC
jgi:hypothetical protein